MRTLNPPAVMAALQQIGLNIIPYKRGPLGKRVASMAKTPSGDGLRMWLPDEATVSISTNKRKKQAVINIREKARSVPNRAFSSRIGVLSDFSDQQQKFIKNFIIEKDIQMLYDQEIIPRNYNWNDDLASWVANSHYIPLKGKIYLSRDTIFVSSSGVSKTRTTATSFLIGVDESKHFISVLPKVAQSVDEAHKFLRPSGLSSKAVRQGEWFFDPLTVDQEADVLRKLAKTSGFLRVSSRSLERGSSHAAKSFTVDRQQYAIGKVRDRRRGYHDSLDLTSVHRVVRNREKTVAAQTKNYD